MQRLKSGKSEEMKMEEEICNKGLWKRETERFLQNSKEFSRRIGGGDVTQMTCDTDHFKICDNMTCDMCQCDNATM